MTTTQMLSPGISHKGSSLHSPSGVASDNDEQSDYMTMTPVHMPKPSPARSRSSTGFAPSPSRAVTNDRASSSSDEGDYAHMKGGCETSIVFQAPSPTPDRKEPSHVTNHQPFSFSPNKTNDLRASMRNREQFVTTKSVDQLPVDLYVPSPQRKNPHLLQGEIKEGGFNKDDEDDYADVQTVGSNLSSHTTPRSSLDRKLTSVSDRNHQNFPSRLKLSPSIEKDFNANVQNSSEWSQIPFRERSGGMSSRNNFLHSSSMEENVSDRAKSISAKTAAGKAARKVLTQSSVEKDVAQMYEMKRASSVGVSRSPSRYSTGVQSRINRNRQYQSMKQLKTSCSPDDVAVKPTSQVHSQSTHSLDKKLLGSRVANRNLIGAGNDDSLSSSTDGKSYNLVKEVDSDEVHRGESFHKALRKGSDGSKMIKYIGDGRKSKSLDKNYMEWLVKTSSFVPRTPSSTSSIAESEGGKCHSTSELRELISSSLGRSTPISRDSGTVEDDEAYEKYKTAVSKHQEEKLAEKQKGGFWHLTKKDKTKSFSPKKTTDSGTHEDFVFENNKEKKLRKSLKKRKKKKDHVGEVGKNNLQSPKHAVKVNEGFHNTNKSNKTVIHDETDTAFANDDDEKDFHPDITFVRKANSDKSPKQNSKRHSSLTRLATVPNKHIPALRDPGGTKQTPKGHNRAASQKGRATDIASGLKSTTTISSLSTLDISLETNYEENSEPSKSPMKPKSRSGRSHTLGRIFGKKTKERKFLDQIKPHSGSAEGLVEDKSALTQMFNITNQIASQFIPSDVHKTALYYMQQVFLVHGFVFEKRDTRGDHGDGTFTLLTGRKNRTLGPLNKYATITGLSSFLKASKEHKVNQPEKAGNKTKDALVNSRTLAAAENAFGWSSADEDIDSDSCFASYFDDRSDSTNCSSNVEKVLPICSEKDHRIVEIAAILLYCIRSSQADLLVGYQDLDEESDDDTVTPAIPDEELEQFLPDCFAKGNELITWLAEVLSAKHAFDEKEDVHFKAPPVPTRKQICGMWQLLLEEGAIAHVRCERHFEDCDFYYGFHKDVLDSCFLPDKILELHEEILASNVDKRPEAMENLMPFWVDELDVADVLIFLRNNFHDAMFRKALRKQPSKRTKSELKMIYEELLHFNSIQHLSDTVKRELTKVLKFEVHTESGKTLFRQGDEGTCWYIILRGSVEVEVAGKGIVCTLQEGDDFGSLALMNNAPRSATIILSDSDCHFIRVDKSDYFRILKDVEENTLRLKEHGKDVLILEKITTTNGDQHEKTNGLSTSEHITTPRRRAHSYSITAGTPERILEHILEYMQPWKITFYDETLENFILMFTTFMKSDILFSILLDRYRSEQMSRILSDRSMKRKIVYFIVRWSYIFTYLRNEDESAKIFLKDLEDEINFDCEVNPQYTQLKEEFAHLYKVEETRDESQDDQQEALFLIEESVTRYQAGSGEVKIHRPLQSWDQVLIKVFNSEQTYTTVKLPLRSSTEEIVAAVTEKLFKKSDTSLKLIEVLETGDRIILPKNQRSIATSIGVNSLLCVSEQKDSFEVKKNQRPVSGVPKYHFDDVSSLEIAYYVTQYDWHLLNNIHVLEYIYKVFGARKFKRITPNLDVLARRFNQLAYWPPTEICTCSNVNKRALILRKFIKIAQHLMRYQNMNGFIAIMIGIGNQAVSRLSNTWEKLPAKYKKLVQEYEMILDPSRNHHNYRVFATSMEPPYIPYFPLLMKDMTFQHEGNDDQKQQLVNFEKMHMISTSIRTIIRGCSVKLEEEAIFSSTKTSEDTKRHVQSMQVITDQRFLNELSSQLEARR